MNTELSAAIVRVYVDVSMVILKAGSILAYLLKVKLKFNSAEFVCR